MILNEFEENHQSWKQGKKHLNIWLALSTSNFLLYKILWKNSSGAVSRRILINFWIVGDKIEWCLKGGKVWKTGIVTTIQWCEVFALCFYLAGNWTFCVKYCQSWLRPISACWLSRDSYFISGWRRNVASLSPHSGTDQFAHLRFRVALSRCQSTFEGMFYTYVSFMW